MSTRITLLIVLLVGASLLWAPVDAARSDDNTDPETEQARNASKQLDAARDEAVALAASLAQNALDRLIEAARSGNRLHEAYDRRKQQIAQTLVELIQSQKYKSDILRSMIEDETIDAESVQEVVDEMDALLEKVRAAVAKYQGELDAEALVVEGAHAPSVSSLNEVEVIMKLGSRLRDGHDARKSLTHVLRSWASSNDQEQEQNDGDNVQPVATLVNHQQRAIQVSRQLDEIRDKSVALANGLESMATDRMVAAAESQSSVHASYDRRKVLLAQQLASLIQAQEYKSDMMRSMAYDTSLNEASIQDIENDLDGLLDRVQSSVAEYRSVLNAEAAVAQGASQPRSSEMREADALINLDQLIISGRTLRSSLSSNLRAVVKAHREQASGSAALLETSDIDVVDHRAMAFNASDRLDAARDQAVAAIEELDRSVNNQVANDAANRDTTHQIYSRQKQAAVRRLADLIKSQEYKSDVLRSMINSDNVDAGNIADVEAQLNGLLDSAESAEQQVRAALSAEALIAEGRNMHRDAEARDASLLTKTMEHVHEARAARGALMHHLKAILEAQQVARQAASGGDEASAAAAGQRQGVNGPAGTGASKSQGAHGGAPGQDEEENNDDEQDEEATQQQIEALKDLSLVQRKKVATELHAERAHAKIEAKKSELLSTLAQEQAAAKKTLDAHGKAAAAPALVETASARGTRKSPFTDALEQVGKLNDAAQADAQRDRQWHAAQQAIAQISRAEAERAQAEQQAKAAFVAKLKAQADERRAREETERAAQQAAAIQTARKLVAAVLHNATAPSEQNATVPPAQQNATVVEATIESDDDDSDEDENNDE